MAEDEGDQPPAWWMVDRRAKRAAERDTRRQERADRRESRRGTRRGAPAREPVTPERVADAALAIVDAEGPDGLTVRSLAQALGVGTMTLYWYVRDKDEILDLVADRMLAPVASPGASGDWRAAVRDLARSVREALLHHARGVPILVARGTFGPNGLRLFEGAVGTFRAAGFGPEAAADAYLTMASYVTGFCVYETSGAGPVAGPAVDRTAFAQRAAGYVAQLPADRFPNLVEVAPGMFGGSRDERFESGLDLVIDGLAARLAAVAPAG